MLDRFELPYKSVYLIPDYFDDWPICMTKKKYSVIERCYKIFLAHILPIRFIYASISFCQQSAMKTNLLKSWSCLPLFFLSVTKQLQVHHQRSLDCSWRRYTNVECIKLHVFRSDLIHCNNLFKIPYGFSQRPKWHPHIAYFGRSTVQKPKRFQMTLI